MGGNRMNENKAMWRLLAVAIWVGLATMLGVFILLILLVIKWLF